MNEEKLIQYIKGTINSKKELKMVLDWIEASEANQKKYAELKNLWVLTGLDQQKADQPRKFFSDRVRTIELKLMSVFKYAAILILVFLSGAYSLYLVNQKQMINLSNAYNEIHVPNGEKSIITLYDGTKVWLNSGTTFKYPVTFTGENRDVYIEGEAFLEVAKDKHKPFVVHAGEMEVMVLGTKFNVYSYRADDLIHTTLEEGHVNVSITGSKKSFELSPGDQFKFSKCTKASQKSKVDTKLYTSWKENMLRFENAKLSEVFKRMERWYDVKIIVDENLNTTERYTITIKTESLREMLNVLSLTTEMNYIIDKDVVKINKP